MCLWKTLEILELFSNRHCNLCQACMVNMNKNLFALLISMDELFQPKIIDLKPIEHVFITGTCELRMSNEYNSCSLNTFYSNFSNFHCYKKIPMSDFPHTCDCPEQAGQEVSSCIEESSPIHFTCPTFLEHLSEILSKFFIYVYFVFIKVQKQGKYTKIKTYKSISQIIFT